MSVLVQLLLKSSWQCSMSDLFKLEEEQPPPVSEGGFRNEVCYDEVGCFSNVGDFGISLNRPLVVLPQSPQGIGIRFFLYTRNAGEHELQVNKMYTLENSDFNSSRETKLIIHGFTHSAHTQWVQDMKAALLTKGDFNVIAVGWMAGATLPFTQATANTRVVGALTGKLLEWLMSESQATPSQFHIIGHSLGAHTAGYVGQAVPGLARISGLDVAGPYFDGTAPQVRLDSSDANFVDAIHTDGSSLFFLGLGTSDPVGHIDFYPNNGVDQPGCPNGLFDKLFTTLTGLISTLDVTNSIEENVACNHVRAIHYYLESINSPCSMVSYPCGSWSDYQKGKCYNCAPDGSRCNVMGYDADQHQARGSFYLDVNGARPFCGYEYDVTVTTTSTAGNVRGMIWVTLSGSLGVTEQLDVTKGAVTLSAGQSQRYRVRTRYDPGTVDAVTVYFEDGTWIIGILFPATWYVDKLEFTGQTPAEHSVKFCTYGTAIKHKERKIFDSPGGDC